MVIGLKCGDRLIYHHTAASPAFASLHAGNVLIRLIGLWMAERDYRILDFGVGDEGYKMRFANADEKLFRVYAAPTRASSLAIRGQIDQRIRRSVGLHRTWDQVVNQKLRGSLRASAQKLRERCRVIKNVYLRGSKRQGFAMLRDRFRTQREIFFVANGTECDPDETVRVLTMPEVFAIQRQEV
jgi:hypothetical protein